MKKETEEAIGQNDTRGEPESLEAQIGKLAGYIMKNFPEEITDDGGAVDTAIQIMEKRREKSNER